MSEERSRVFFPKLSYLSDEIHSILSQNSGFGGIEVAWWPLAPKFAGSHPAEAVGFLGQNILSNLPLEGK
jgi:hypothetical protein